MEILDYLFEKSKPPVDESDMPVESSILSDYEAIVALLTYSTWKGKPREVSTLSIGWQAPEWFARMSDPENRRSLTSTGKSVVEAIESLSKHLLLGKDARWYPWRGSPTSNGKSASNSSTHSVKAKKSRGKSE